MPYVRVRSTDGFTFWIPARVVRKLAFWMRPPFTRTDAWFGGPVPYWRATVEARVLAQMPGAFVAR